MTAPRSNPSRNHSTLTPDFFLVSRSILHAPFVAARQRSTSRAPRRSGRGGAPSATRPAGARAKRPTHTRGRCKTERERGLSGGATSFTRRRVLWPALSCAPLFLSPLHPPLSLPPHPTPLSISFSPASPHSCTPLSPLTALPPSPPLAALPPSPPQLYPPLSPLAALPPSLRRCSKSWPTKEKRGPRRPTPNFRTCSADRSPTPRTRARPSPRPRG